ncbi:hypothetical protein RZS08_00495, partial [Arthrospira platensis SPKY1]|nr:hypothetical protein [Arthrospira platensis SPKY1]
GVVNLQSRFLTAVIRAAPQVIGFCYVKVADQLSEFSALWHLLKVWVLGRQTAGPCASLIAGGLSEVAMHPSVEVTV